MSIIRKRDELVAYREGRRYNRGPVDSTGILIFFGTVCRAMEVRMLRVLGLCTTWLVLFSLQVHASGVVINEVFYHAPDDYDELEWIELYNTSDEAVDLTDWKFTKGVRFQFPADSTIAPHGYLVLSKNADLFREFYDAPVWGTFEGSLNDGGEAIELVNAKGKRVDEIDYEDSGEWPVAPDGYSASLERICPTADSAIPANWAASPMPADQMLPAGSPGEQNHSYSASLPPIVESLTVSPPSPAAGQALTVTATVAASESKPDVVLLYREVRPGSIGEEQQVTMASTNDGSFTAEIPSQGGGTLIRYRVRATDADGVTRSYPAEYALRPAQSVYVMGEQEIANIPLGFFINTNPDDVEAAKQVWQRGMESTGPFGRGPRANAGRMMEGGLDIESLWFLVSIEQSLDADAYAKALETLQNLDARRTELKNEVLGAEDIEAVMPTLQGRLQEFQQQAVAEIAGALPEGAAEDFQAAWEKQSQPGPMQFLKRFMAIERLWFALSMEFDFSEEKLNAMRDVFQIAIKTRSDQLPAMQKLMNREGDFQDFQEAIGKAEQKMWQELAPVLSFRQTRFAKQWGSEQGSPIRPRSSPVKPLPPRGQSAFVYVEQQTKQAEVFDFVNIRERSAGFKVRLHKDRPLHEMTTVNVIFEYQDRFVLAEPLAFELYRRLGSPACQTEFVRLTVDDKLVGYHLLFEQPNRAFLRRNERGANGNLYKLVWYGRGIEGQHEKKTNVDDGHDDLLKLVHQLETTQGDEQWAVIQQHFNIEQVNNYFVANTCLTHWDGFFNNYFAYHDVGDTDKWEMYPWDQDKTWGFYDRLGEGEFFVNMPLTFGMEGDTPPDGGEARLRANTWWRPGGFFSKPLLANPEFRKLFLARMHEVLENVYCEEAFFPAIDAVAEQLRPEIPIRAAAVGEPVEEALRRFNVNIDMLKRQLVERRAYLLEQEELSADE